MIKTIATDQLAVGMYIHDLKCSWIDHPFLSNQFRIKDHDTIRKIRDAGIVEAYIDTSRGLDVPTASTDAPAADNIVATVTDAPAAVSEKPTAKLSGPIILPTGLHAEEVRRARKLHQDATQLVGNMMADIRLGKQIEVDQCEPLVDDILDSIFRFPSALLPLAQMKTVDEYTFQHSVSVSALAVAFGRTLNMPRDIIKELALGGLLHDVGKAQVPARILNKPGKLTDDEFAVMKQHATYSANLLKHTKGVSEIALMAAAQHHERYDGSGYPHRLKGAAISIYGQMLAITDVYDAITSLRVYHNGMPPTEALRKMYEWSKTHFDPSLVQAFIKGIGIYPAGSLVRMESGIMGIVRETAQNNLLKPVVKTFYHADKKCYLDPKILDLSTVHDKIIAHESFEKWGIDQARWL